MKLARPLPPPALREDGNYFLPAREVHDFIRAAFIDPAGPFWRAEYEHLEVAHIGVLWTNVPKIKGMVQWAASAELVTMGGDKWTKGRALQQYAEWFMGWWDGFESGEGEIPDFIITIYGPGAAESNDAGFCRTIAHELRHCAQKLDNFGEPAFDNDGRPQYAIRDHDVSEFVSVVEDFGPIGANVSALVSAAARAPRFPGAYVAGVCGVCLKAVA